MVLAKAGFCIFINKKIQPSPSKAMTEFERKSLVNEAVKTLFSVFYLILVNKALAIALYSGLLSIN